MWGVVVVEPDSDAEPISGPGIRFRRLTSGGPLDHITQNDEGARPYLLALMKNGIGSSTHVDYRPSTDWDNKDTSGVPRLPFPIWTVTGIERDDGLCAGGAAPGCVEPAAPHPDRAHYTRADFIYRGGKYDPATREFRGFGTVEQYDAQQNLTRTFFHQDRALKGKSRLVERPHQLTAAFGGPARRLNFYPAGALPNSVPVSRIPQGEAFIGNVRVR